MKRLLPVWLAASSGLMAIFLLGCPGNLDPGVTGGGGMGGSNGAGCEVQLLATKCATCHATASPQGALDLQSDGIPARLVDHDSADSAAGG